MNNLGHYYQFIDYNYNLMIKYYLMAIEKGNSYAMNNLGYYYEIEEKKYDLMKKYYVMAIKNKNQFHQIKKTNILAIYCLYKNDNYKLL
jgi:TPR repeat protein